MATFAVIETRIYHVEREIGDADPKEAAKQLSCDWAYANEFETLEGVSLNDVSFHRIEDWFSGETLMTGSEFNFTGCSQDADAV